MKIKTAFLGLLFASSTIHLVLADPYDSQLEEDELDVALMGEKDNLKVKEAEQDKLEDLIKLGATLAMTPSIIYKNQVFSTKNALITGLTFKVDVPKAWCKKDATVGVDAVWKDKYFTLWNAVITVGRMVTIGYTSSIFGYSESDFSWLISTCTPVLQIKYESVFDCFCIGYAIEKPVVLQLGLSDAGKDKIRQESRVSSDDTSKAPVDQLATLKGKADHIKVENNFPALGFKLEVVTDCWKLGLSGLGLCTDYVCGNDPNEKKLPSMYCVAYGGNLGVQCQIIPKKFTATGQGLYIHGLGGYVSGLAAIQSDEGDRSMCASYYINKETGLLSAVDAWGLGGALEYCVTPKWTLSIGGSYLTIVEDLHKFPVVFCPKWNIIPRVNYAVSKYFAISSGYSLLQKNKKLKHKLSGSIKFSL